MQVLNGGMHAAFNLMRGKKELIDQTLRMLTQAKHACAHLAGRRLVHVVWTGIHAMVDDVLIRKFPHQTWNASLRFDQETGDHAGGAWGVRSLFLTSLTRGAATLDGVHPLTDTALAAAHVLLRAMELVADGDTSLLLEAKAESRNRSASAEIDTHAPT